MNRVSSGVAEAWPMAKSPTIDKPAMRWQTPNRRWGCIHLSATMPISVGMKMETIP